MWRVNLPGSACPSSPVSRGSLPPDMSREISGEGLCHCGVFVAVSKIHRGGRNIFLLFLYYTVFQ